ncbi:acetyl-CoA carboxylase, carboxyltransferase subunit beta [Spirochaeta thermophila]|uniref:Acetyl-coenzyme A carboxylase carboxyl transferase subunit beta n=1 Tax=Winmispira thermophila (strain ATCC 49972 / DSM 6192 / RI 19.B1) TaxID=665571 RepID=E0RS20_WINT6|nr:acetyl-CoA carboxylase, carboxyltransferase subunit beta [Spirochaeta thermophila]ADN01807.1 acetyl-coenzyme A carboxylase carboxyl transferase subunit beta [Spirochaeta thermophila DSM 6192]
MKLGDVFRKVFGGVGAPQRPGLKPVLGLDPRRFVEKKHQCPVCQTHVDSWDLKEHLYVCPSCDYHFRLDAWERIELLVDEGSFEEYDADLRSDDPLGFPDYREKLQSAMAKTGLNEAVVNGKGAVEGRELLLSVMSFFFIGGSMGSVVGEKVMRAMLRAIDMRLPLLICTASGGARMQEGIFSLMQMAKTSHAAALMEKERIPLFILLTDPTTGGVTASFAMLGDVILAEPGALIGFAGPRVIEGTIRQKLPEGFQRAAFQQEKGFVDAVVHRRDLRKTLTFLMDTHRIPQRGWLGTRGA